MLVKITKESASFIPYEALMAPTFAEAVMRWRLFRADTWPGLKTAKSLWLAGEELRGLAD